MKYGLDLHGVVLNANEAKRRALERVTRLSIEPLPFGGKCVIEQGVWYPYQEGGGGRPVEVSDYDEAMRLLHETDEFFEFAEPMPGAVEAIAALSAAGHDICIVSGVRGLNEGRVWAFIHAHRLPICEVVATRKKPKTPHYEKCNVVVDDEVRHLYPLLHLANIVKVLMLPGAGVTGSKSVRPPHSVPDSFRVVCGWRETSLQDLPMAA